MISITFTKHMKRILKCIVLLSLFAVFTLGCSTLQNENLFQKNKKQNLEIWSKSPTVLLISIDGFRSDYLQKFNPITLQQWAREGVLAEGLIPSFPSLTFPNHVTLVTGKTPGHHGIVSNSFYDQKLKKSYHMMDGSAVNDGQWYQAEPIWAVAEKSGMLSGVCFWVGGEARIAGVDPTYLRPYDGKLSNSDRVEQVIRWLALPERDRPHFLTLYFSDVDTQGHHHGPDSKQVEEAVQQVDHALAKLQEWIQTHHFDLQIIVVSDHGMKKVDSMIETSAWVSEKKFKIFEKGASMLLYAKDLSSQELESEYLQIKKHEVKGFRVYKQSEIPQKWKYDFKSRVGDLLLVANPGLYLTRSEGASSNSYKSYAGTHGWDPLITPEMSALFIAHGSAFKSKLSIPKFDNVHVYPMILKTLSLPIPANIDGDEKVLQNIYKD